MLRRLMARTTPGNPPGCSFDMERDGLTIVTPSFEKHVVQFGHMVDSLVEHCLDLSRVRLIAIVEAKNEAMFVALLARYPALSADVVVTEDVLSSLGIHETPGAFLSRIGKFTFQTVKKLGGLARVETAWSLVLDSEGLFHKSFRAIELLDDYRARKYVFYTHTAPRGRLWHASTGYQVTRNCAAALSMPAGGRWYMEYFHWFYETAKVRDLIDNRLGKAFFQRLADPTVPAVEYFENILYYLYIEKHHAGEYALIDFKAEIDALLPIELSRRFDLSELPFSLFGNEYLLNVLAPGDIAALGPLFAKYRLPFVRLEPPFFSTGYLPALCGLPSFVATISSHHAIWLRKKIAVCVSGEFRHIVHRTPEHHIRHLLGFLAGVDCDIFLHGWSNSSEAAIVEALKPRAHLFEPRPSFAAIAREIAVTEPDIKPGRDEGSLAMFHGIEQAHRLMEPFADDYDYVLRIRPDIYSELSLKEMLVRISDEGDFLSDAIYVPRHFHSKGINDQLALGPVRQMGIYARTFDYVKENARRLFFNPETVLLRHLLDRGVAIALVDMPYALMREVPVRIDTIHERFHQQFHVWWSRTEDLPPFQDLTGYFTDKLAAVDAAMRQTVPDLIYVRSGDAVIRARVFENDPSRPAFALFAGPGYRRIGGFVLEGTGVVATDAPVSRQLFLFPDGGRMVVSEWRMDHGRLVNHRITVGVGDHAATARALGVRMGVANYMHARRHKWFVRLADRVGRLIGW